MRKARVIIPIAIIAVVALATVLVTTATAESGPSRFRVNLTGDDETPLAVSSPGGGTFTAKINRSGNAIDYTLSYASFPSAVTQAHVHFGSVSQTGGISFFLCTNLGNGPAGTQACPAEPATISGTIHAADVIGPAAQGIAAGELNEIIAAMRSGAAYVNIHTADFPIGEARHPLGHQRN